MDERVSKVTEIYGKHRLRNGDLAMVVPQTSQLHEFEAMADRWDGRCRGFLGDVLREAGFAEVYLMVARPEAEPLAQDHAMWADLQDELRGSETVLHPLIGLPCAAA